MSDNKYDFIEYLTSLNKPKKEKIKKCPSEEERKELIENKFNKYSWVVDHFARLIDKHLYRTLDGYKNQTRHRVEIYSYKSKRLHTVYLRTIHYEIWQRGQMELRRQIARLYNNSKLCKKYWVVENNDLKIGPFFLKANWKTYLADKQDSGSIKYIKGRMLNYFREIDRLTVRERKIMKKINKINKETMEHYEMEADNTYLSQVLKISEEEVDRIKKLDRFSKTMTYGLFNESGDHDKIK